MPHGCTDSKPLPLILFSGLAADDRVFAPQKLAFPQLIVPRWRVPEPGESLPDYCRHIAHELALPGPVIVGGISFGGIVAAEFARHVDARCLVLISSIRSRRELPRRLRALGMLRFALGAVPLRPIQYVLGRVAGSARFPISPLVRGVLHQVAAADPRVVRWSIRQIYRFDEVQLTIPVRRIHGDRDPLFPLRYVTTDQVVHGGGHVLTLTHAKEVNDFLRRSIDALGDHGPLAEPQEAETA